MKPRLTAEVCSDGACGYMVLVLVGLVPNDVTSRRSFFFSQ